MSMIGKRARRVLVLDDEALILSMLQEMLTVLNYDSDVVTHGNEAVALYAEALNRGDAYCAVVVDLTLSEGINGVETARQIRELDREAPLIVSSGYSTESEMALYRRYGFVATLPKPYSMSVLKEVIDGVCDKVCHA